MYSFSKIGLQICDLWLPESRGNVKWGSSKYGGTPTLWSNFHAAPQITAKSLPNAPETQEITTTQVTVEQGELFYCISVHFGDNLKFPIHSFMTVSHNLGYWTVVAVVWNKICCCGTSLIVHLRHYLRKSFRNLLKHEMNLKSLLIWFSEHVAIPSSLSEQHPVSLRNDVIEEALGDVECMGNFKLSPKCTEIQ